MYWLQLLSDSCLKRWMLAREVLIKRHDARLTFVRFLAVRHTFETKKDLVVEFLFPSHRMQIQTIDN